MTQISQLSAAELSEAYASGAVSPVEVTQAVLARIDAWEPSINAMYRIHREQALDAARASEARWRAGQPRSPLDGVPITIKENIYTHGDPAPIGTAAGDLTPKAADAPPSARVREAGCVLLGKTTMPDFGMLSSGLSTIHGTTRNPWRLDRNPAGSSSGAGAAGAAGYGPLHLGTDIGGSVRLPASVCGLFGLKPSLGRIPIDPPFMARAAGPMTRTVRDSAMLMNLVTRPDARDYRSLRYDPCDYAAQLEAFDLDGVRVGVLSEMGVGLPVHPEVAAATQAAARALAGAGAIVEPTRSFLTEAMFDGVLRFFEARSHNDLVQMTPETRAKVLPFIVEWCTWRAGGFTGRDVISAYAQIQALREAAVRVSGGYDFLLSPTAPVPAWDALVASPSNDPHDALSHIAFTAPWNFSEQPAASVNWCATDDGLPIGVQVVGRRFDDLGVLRLSRVIERLRPAQGPWPELA